jgi:hypothetical protein
MSEAEAFLAAIEQALSWEEELLSLERKVYELNWIASAAEEQRTKLRSRERELRRGLAGLRRSEAFTVLLQEEAAAAQRVRDNAAAQRPAFTNLAAACEQNAAGQVRLASNLRRSMLLLTESRSVLREIEALLCGLDASSLTAGSTGGPNP